MEKKDWKTNLTEFLNSNEPFTDSDLEDFAFYNEVSTKDVFQFVAEYKTKGTVCANCKNVAFFPNDMPCSICSRHPWVKDRFEKVDGKIN